jgi:hypothetical protein
MSKYCLLFDYGSVCMHSFLKVKLWCGDISSTFQKWDISLTLFCANVNLLQWVFGIKQINDLMIWRVGE